jgi:hypothetical protein
MAEKEFCTNGWGKGKVKYRTHAAAEKGARRTQSGLGLHIYECRHCRGWHFSKQAPQNKVEAIPSAAKLRRQFEGCFSYLVASWPFQDA